MRLPALPPPLERRDAARRALQAATGAVLAWLILLALPTGEYFVGILSAVLILNPSADGTIRAARTRLLATLVGCVVGGACFALLPESWGGFAGLALSVGILTAAAYFRPDWTYGIVAAVSLATTGRAEPWAAALERIASIGVGASVGIAVAFVLWPDRARDRFDAHMARALAALSDLAGEVTQVARETAPGFALPAARRMRKHLRLARETVELMNGTAADAPRARLDAVDRMVDAIHFLHRAAAVPADLAQEDGLGDALQAFREALAEAIGNLPQPGGDRRTGDGPATRAQREVTRRIDAGEVSDTRFATVLAFAMDEVDRALAACRAAWT